MKRFQVLAARLVVGNKVFLRDDIIFDHEFDGFSFAALEKNGGIKVLDESEIFNPKVPDVIKSDLKKKSRWNKR